MLFLVGGSSRSGKTLIAKRILERTGFPYLSLDWIVMGFTNGMPRLGIHDKLFPHEIAERIQPFFESMCDSILWMGQDLVIEGEAFFPESARKLLDEHPNVVSACFLGYAQIQVEKKVRETKSFSGSERDWLLQESDEVIHQHIRNMVEHSRKVEAQCADHDVRYFDTSADFAGTLNLATEYLLSGA